MRIVLPKGIILLGGIYIKELSRPKKILANIENDDIDLTLIIEQLWEDLQLAYNQIGDTTNRSNEYAEFHHLN